LYIYLLTQINVSILVIIGAVGLDEDNQQTPQVDEGQIKRETERKKVQREKERKEYHDYKESERDHLRNKYQLKSAQGTNSKKPRSSASPKRSSTTKSSDSNEDNKCSIS